MRARVRDYWCFLPGHGGGWWKAANHGQARYLAFLSARDAFGSHIKLTAIRCRLSGPKEGEFHA